MLVVNLTPGAVEPRSATRPFGRVPRRREVDCDVLETAAAAARGRRQDDNPMHDRRVWRGSNFVRQRPERPSVPETSAALRRKLDEADARLRRRRRQQRDAGTGGAGPGRAHAVTQSTGPPDQPGKRTLAVQTSETVAVQTVACAVTPLTPPPVKCKTGPDAGTQVTCRDLVDQDEQVERLAVPLVATALEKAAVAVLFRENEAASRACRTALEAKRLAERVERCALERHEGARRQAGQRALAAAERADPGPTFKAVQARALASTYAAGLCADAVGQLTDAGYLCADEGPMDGWLRDRCHELDSTRDHLDSLVRETIVRRSSHVFQRQIGPVSPKRSSSPS